MLSKTKPNKKRRSRKQSKPEENLKNIKKLDFVILILKWKTMLHSAKLYPSVKKKLKPKIIT